MLRNFIFALGAKGCQLPSWSGIIFFGVFFGQGCFSSSTAKKRRRRGPAQPSSAAGAVQHSQAAPPAPSSTVGKRLMPRLTQTRLLDGLRLPAGRRPAASRPPADHRPASGRPPGIIFFRIGDTPTLSRPAGNNFFFAQCEILFSHFSCKLLPARLAGNNFFFARHIAKFYFRIFW